MAIDITIHDTVEGTCSLSGKECEGLIVSFKDGTFQEVFLSQKSFLQIVKLKTGKGGKKKKDPVGVAMAITPPPNGETINRNHSIGVGLGSSEAKPVVAGESKPVGNSVTK